MSKEKTFILGVGCQRGGTTWLYEYLRDHPQSDMGFRKEYHVFDTIYLKGRQRDFKEEIALCQKILKNEIIIEKYRSQFKLLDFYHDLNAYYDYFQLLALRRKNTKIVGDITPSYSGLPVPAFKSIKENLVARDFKIRVIFLMRDPVDRIWSAVRLKQHKNIGEKFESVVDAVIADYAKPHCILRTRYEQTIENLELVFSADELHFAFYESFISPEGMRTLTDFLDLSFIDPPLTEKINSAPNSRPLPVELQAEIAQFYKSTYQFCARRFGHEMMQGLWPSMKFVEM